MLQRSKLPGLLRRNPRRTHSLGLVIVTDPGPDPDDIKALLMQNKIVLRVVIAKGGQQAESLARLARCVLNLVGVFVVPVGIGSAGKPYQAQPHEYKLEGFEDVDASTLQEGSQLLLSVLCASHLPEWCTKQWFFVTFYDMDPETIAENGLDQMGASTEAAAEIAPAA